jgi:DNA-directed RNA polymerase sigma subunit (sigma70/sigma32)
MPRTIPQQLPSVCIDPLAHSPAAIAEQRELECLISQTLTDKERRVIQSRFFNPNGKETFRQIGRALNLSAERTRQLQVSALRKLQLMFRTTSACPG